MSFLLRFLCFHRICQIRYQLFHNHLLHIDIKAQQADQGKFLLKLLLVSGHFG